MCMWDRIPEPDRFIYQSGLMKKDIFEEAVQGEEKIKRVTEKGRAVGIREEERQAKYGRNYYALIHTRESQQMILEELGKYLLQFTPAV